MKTCPRCDKDNINALIKRHEAEEYNCSNCLTFFFTAKDEELLFFKFNLGEKRIYVNLLFSETTIWHRGKKIVKLATAKKELLKKTHEEIYDWLKMIVIFS